MIKLPHGCDQQGRHPEVREEPEEPDNSSVNAVVKDAAIAVAFFAVACVVLAIILPVLQP